MKKYSLTINGKKYDVEIRDFGVTTATVSVNGKETTVNITYPENEDQAVVVPKVAKKKKQPAIQPAAQAATTIEQAGESVFAPMPGLILQILVKEGDTVSPGQKVMTMEAMKMENDINATMSGTVRKILVSEGDNVQEKQALITIG